MELGRQREAVVVGIVAVARQAVEAADDHRHVVGM